MEAKKILFNASSAGSLMTEKKGTEFTEVNKLRVEELISERDTGINKNGNKVKWEGTLKPSELEELITKRDATPELSDTAKNYIKRVWLKYEKGIVKSIKSKFLDKGLFQEEESITLLTEVENIAYSKNEERRENEFFTGECDIFKDFGLKKIVIDTKTCWDAETFINAKPSLDNEIQGVVYMEQWDADEFHLKFCLVDTPEHLVQREKDLEKWKYYSGDMNPEELDAFERAMEPIYDQIEQNLVYSNNPKIKREECIKTFVFYRDKEKYQKLVSKAKLGLEYYKTISLNMIK
jgi:hypothetical protein